VIFGAVLELGILQQRRGRRGLELPDDVPGRLELLAVLAVDPDQPLHLHGAVETWHPVMKRERAVGFDGERMRDRIDADAHRKLAVAVIAAGTDAERKLAAGNGRTTLALEGTGERAGLAVEIDAIESDGVAV